MSGLPFFTDEFSGEDEKLYKGEVEIYYISTGVNFNQ